MLSRLRPLAYLKRSLFLSHIYVKRASRFDPLLTSAWPATCHRFSSVAVKASLAPSEHATADINQADLKRTILARRVSYLLLGEEDRSKKFSELWELIMSLPTVDISTINAFLSAKIDFGLTINRHSVLKDLQHKSLFPNTRTYSSFLHECCSKGDMEEASAVIEELKKARLKPDASFFSEVLYGYAKAGMNDEVTSTKELMERVGLWPSRIPYEGLLCAYAELGDLSSLQLALKEAWKVLPSFQIDSSSHSFDSPFPPSSLIHLYVRANCHAPVSTQVCHELLTHLPSPADFSTCVHARDGVKRLLFHGRSAAAEDLFSHANPENSDDSYLISLTRYAAAGGLDRHALEAFWKLASASGSRLNALRTYGSIFIRPKPHSSTDLYSKLKDAFKRNDIDAVFATIQAESTGSNSLVYNYAVPMLLRQGLTPFEIIDRLESPSLKSCAAFGSVLGRLSFDSTPGVSSVNLNNVSSLVDQLVGQGYLPMDNLIFLSPTVARNILTPALTSDSSPEAYTRRIADIFPSILTPVQIKAVVSQMLSVLLMPQPHRVSASKQPLSAEHMKIVHTLVKWCTEKDLKFPFHSWMFYKLRDCGLDQAALDSLRLPPLSQTHHDETFPTLKFSSNTGLTRPSSNIKDIEHVDEASNQHLFSEIENMLCLGKVDTVIEHIRKFNQDSDSSSKGLEFPDVIALAYDMVTNSTEGSSSPVTSQDVERLFWASWDSQLVHNPAKSLNLVAQCYLATSNFKAMAGFFQRVSNQLGPLQGCLLKPYFMKPLILDNISDNATLLQSMISNPFLSISEFARSACALTYLAKESLHTLPNPAIWQSESDQYWPIQTLNKRFSGANHLHKVRGIHIAVEELCENNNLFAAQSLRVWANHLGLLIFTRTNELLVFTAQLLLSRDRLRTLPQLCLTHGLTLHRPINLSSHLLSSLDSVLLVPSIVAPLSDASAVKNVANWIHEHIRPDACDTVDAPRYLPTWLVISQRMLQSGSAFIPPSTWTALACEWLASADNNVPHTVDQLSDWYTCAPTVSHKAALLISALANSSTQDWGLNQIRSDGLMIYHILGSFDPETVLTPEQQKHFSDALAVLNLTSISQLRRVFNQTQSTTVSLEDFKAQFDTREFIEALAKFSLVTQLFHIVPQTLSRIHPESLPVFFDYLLTDLRRSFRPFRSVKRCIDLMHKFSVDVQNLSIENRAFLHATLRASNLTKLGLLHPLSYLKPLLPSDIRTSFMDSVHNSLARNNYHHIVQLFKSLDPQIRDKSFQLLLYSLPDLLDGNRFKSLISVLAAQPDTYPLLEQSAMYLRPFARDGLSEACLAIYKCLSGENVDWFHRACVRFHKLGHLLEAKAGLNSPAQKYKHLDLAADLALLVKPPPTSMVQTILSVQSDSVKLSETLDQYLPSCTFHHKVSLLHNLISTGAKDAVDAIILRSQSALSNRPYSAFVEIVSNTDPDVVIAAAGAALEQLNKLDSKDLFACLKGPHVDILFRRWPKKHLSSLLQLVCSVPFHQQTSLPLHLSSIMVNRGFCNLVNSITQKLGPLPITFLAGNPRYVLTPSEIEATSAYLRATDPEHLPTFADISIRNAIYAANAAQSTRLENLLRSLTSQLDPTHLKDVCTLPTVNLINDFLQQHPELADGLKEQLSDIVVHWNNSGV